MATIWLLSIVPLAYASTQTEAKGTAQEQSSFALGSDSDEPRVKRPVPVPDEVLKVLRADKTVEGCLEDNPLLPGKSLNSWFLASSIHLDGNKHSDLIVVPSFVGKELVCFESASGIAWFWVFRRIGDQYTMILKASGNSMRVLRTTSNGYRNIRTGSIGQAGRQLTTVNYAFNGENYAEVGRSTQEQQ